MALVLVAVDDDRADVDDPLGAAASAASSTLAVPPTFTRDEVLHRAPLAHVGRRVDDQLGVLERGARSPSRSATSAIRGSTPAARSSASCSGETSMPTTSAPSAARARQIAEPMKPSAPVTATRRPWSSICSTIQSEAIRTGSGLLYSPRLAAIPCKASDAGAVRVAATRPRRRRGRAGGGVRGAAGTQEAQGPAGGDHRRGGRRARWRWRSFAPDQDPRRRALRAADVGLPALQGPPARRPRGAPRAGFGSTIRSAPTARSAAASCPARDCSRHSRGSARGNPLDRTLSWVHWMWFFEPHGSLLWILAKHPERFPRAARQMSARLRPRLRRLLAGPDRAALVGVREGLRDPATCAGSCRRSARSTGAAPGTDLYASLGGNPWAAMPSLHFATSLMAALLLTEAGPVEGAARLGLRRCARLRARLPGRALRDRPGRRRGPGRSRCARASRWSSPSPMR